jgi:hypothetical protein
MAAGVTYNIRLQGNRELGSSLSKGVKQGFGVLNLASSSTYALGGVTVTFGGFRRVSWVQVGPASGLAMEYLASTNRLVLFRSPTTTAAVFQELASDTAMTNLTAVPFCVIGT